MDDNTKLFEVVKVSVDRGKVDVGSNPVDLLGQFLGRPFSGIVEQGLQQEPA